MLSDGKEQAVGSQMKSPPAKTVGGVGKGMSYGAQLAILFTHNMLNVLLLAEPILIKPPISPRRMKDPALRPRSHFTPDGFDQLGTRLSPG